MATRVTSTDVARSINDRAVTPERRSRDDVVDNARREAERVNGERTDRTERRAVRVQLQRVQRPEPQREPEQQRLPGRRAIGQNLDVFA